MRMIVAGLMVFCLGSFVALMSQGKKEAAPTFPRTIYLIRHAEKPPDSDASVHLSEAGLKRANALHELFDASKTRPEPFAKPDALFAPKPSGKSRRSTETLEPLAKHLDMTIGADHNKEDVEKLAAAIFHTPAYAGKVVMIAWNHTYIPALATALKVPNPPLHWKDEVFDRVWEITYGTGGKAEVRDRPQRLLEGDKAK